MSKLAAVAAALVAVTAARLAHAETSQSPANTAPTTPLELAPVTQPGSLAPSDDDHTKSPAGAFFLALGGSAIGPALITTALMNGEWDAPLHDEVVPLMVAGSAFAVLGPSLGNWYAGKGWSRGLKLRLAGGAGMAVGAAIFVQNVFPSLLDSSNTSANAGASAGAGIFIAGAAAVAIGTVLDVADAPESAAEYNRAHAQRRFSITPVVSRTAAGQQTGLAMVGTF